MWCVDRFRTSSAAVVILSLSLSIYIYIHIHLYIWAYVFFGGYIGYVHIICLSKPSRRQQLEEVSVVDQASGALRLMGSSSKQHPQLL